MLYTSFKGLIVTGGNGAWKSVELFDVKTGKHCTLPQLPHGRVYHTQVVHEAFQCTQS